VAGLVGWVVGYVVARPRPSRCGDLITEAWRIYAIVAAIPLGIVGAELYLWVHQFDYHAPVGMTGVIPRAGVAVLVLAPALVIHQYCRHVSTPTPGRRPLWIAVAMAIAGLLMYAGGWQLRASRWTAVAAAAERSPSEARQILDLKGYGYVNMSQARLALDGALVTHGDALALATLAEDGGVGLDGDIEDYPAGRLEAGIANGDLGEEALPALWPLISAVNGGEDRFLRAYARVDQSVPAASPSATGGEPALADAAMSALDHASPDVRRVFLVILARQAAHGPLPDAVVTAVATQLGDGPPLDQMAVAVLLREGSRAALRPILPRFADPDAPEWDLLQANCPTRTRELVALSRDDDRTVVSGAWAVLSYVRQYCVTTRSPTG
jgi:hypothetical protein